MVETHAVLEVADGIFDLGVAAMVCLQFQGVAVPVSDEGVIAVGGEQGQLRAGRGLHPPDDEPHRSSAGLTLEGGVGGLRHVDGAVHPGTGVQSAGMASMRFRKLLADGDGKADIQLVAERDDGVGVKAAIVSCPVAPAWRTRPTVSRRK